MIADDRLPGFFLDIWRRLSHPFPLRLLRQHPYPDNTCFSTLLLAPYTAHTQSLLTYKAGTADEVLCESVVLQAVSMWLRHLFRDLLPPDAAYGFADMTASSRADSTQGSDLSMLKAINRGTSRSGPTYDTSRSSNIRHYSPAASVELAELQPTPTQSQPPLQHLHVLWLSRSRFERQHEAHLTAWQRARQLTPEQQAQLLVELQRAVLQWNQQTCVPGQSQGCISRCVMFTLQVRVTADRINSTLLVCQCLSSVQPNKHCLGSTTPPVLRTAVRIISHTCLQQMVFCCQPGGQPVTAYSHELLPALNNSAHICI